MNELHKIGISIEELKEIQDYLEEAEQCGGQYFNKTMCEYAKRLLAENRRLQEVAIFWKNH